MDHRVYKLINLFYFLNKHLSQFLYFITYLLLLFRQIRKYFHLLKTFLTSILGTLRQMAIALNPY